MAIGEVITQADLQSIQRENDKLFSQRAYLAPTVFRLAKAGLNSYNFYSSKSDAFAKSLFLQKLGGKNIPPVGAVPFTKDVKAQTLGINTDFFLPTPSGLVPMPYERLKTLSNWYGIVFRFFTTVGEGPYYAILDSRYFGTSATPIDKVSPDKIAALDAFHRELQLLKIKYNSLADYLTSLSKRRLNDVEQQSFNEGILLLGNLKEEMRTINGAEFTYSANGSISGIGIIPIIVYIIAALIIAAAAAWTIDKITTERQKTARINSSYDMQKWIAEQKLKIAAAVKAGIITPAAGDQQTNDLNKASEAAQDVIKKSSEETAGPLDKIQNMLLIAAGVFILSKIIK